MSPLLLIASVLSRVCNILAEIFHIGTSHLFLVPMILGCSVIVYTNSTSPLPSAIFLLF